LEPRQLERRKSANGGGGGGGSSSGSVGQLIPGCRVAFMSSTTRGGRKHGVLVSLSVNDRCDVLCDNGSYEVDVPISGVQVLTSSLPPPAPNYKGLTTTTITSSSRMSNTANTSAQSELHSDHPVSTTI